MSAVTVISQAFGENANLYTVVLGLDEESINNNDKPLTQSQLRKAYYRRALLFHPDKQQNASKSKEEIEDTKLKFQAVSLAYTILSDVDKRREYDESGEINDDDENASADGNGNGSNFNMWKDFFSSTFGKVTKADIDQFTQSYKCSEEEEKDVLKYYTMFKGNLDKMLECVMCSDVIDKERWVQDYIQPAIDNESVKDFSETLQKTLGGDDVQSSKKKSKAKTKTKKKVSSRKMKAKIEEEQEVEVVVEPEEEEEDLDDSSCVNDDDENENDDEDDDSMSKDEESFQSSIVSADEAGSDEDKTETEEDQTETEEDSDNSSSNSSKSSSRSSSSSKRSINNLSGEKSAPPSKRQKQTVNTNSGPKNKKAVTSLKKKKKGQTTKASASAPDDDLIAAIRGNATARRGGGEGAFGSFMNNLEQRYASPKPKTKKKKKGKKTKSSAYTDDDDIPDDEFAKIQARLLKKKK
jgi:DnaJ family protein C protein 9